MLATPALPQSRPLTILRFEVVHEEGFQGTYGRCHLTSVAHPYPFVSRKAAAAFGALMCERHCYDGYRLHTPGYVPPPVAVFDDCEIPF